MPNELFGKQPHAYPDHAPPTTVASVLRQIYPLAQDHHRNKQA